ncbi:MAG: ADP-ribosylglycohydrolase family protein [Clostridiales bacterium]|jgi:type I restriction enzyme M protein|nr:ADP-ribosylglycohydrolase family protein [Clostridiales bacterium]
MIGAIIGDIVGSRFEFNNIKTKKFDLFGSGCCYTDDSVMSLAIAKAILESDGDKSKLGATAERLMRKLGREYLCCGFGGMFFNWLLSEDPKPYKSFGNGSAMRVSACGFAAKNVEEAKELSKAVTEITHNHPEGIKGAEAVAVCVFLAKEGCSRRQIGEYVKKNYYPINFTLNEIRATYKFNETCQKTVPQAIAAFLESTSFEDAIRNAVSIGGDSDTLGAIAGAIAEAFYGVPDRIRSGTRPYLDDTLYNILTEFEAVYPPKKGI